MTPHTPHRISGHTPVPPALVGLVALTLLASVAHAAPPSTAPAVPAPLGDPAPYQPLVMIFPFDAVGEHTVGWLPVAVQHSLVAELSRVGRFRPSPVEVPEGRRVDTDAPQWARDRGARYVILGTYQLINNNDLRITGQVIEAPTGNVIAGLKASGPLRDLFTLEDSLATQAKRALLPAPPAVAQATTAPTAQPAPSLPSPVAIQSSGPVQATPPRLQAQFEGSALQKSLSDPRSYAQTFGAQRDQYRYYSNPAYPYFYGYGFRGGGYYYTPYLGPTNYVYTYPGGLGAW